MLARNFSLLILGAGCLVGHAQTSAPGYVITAGQDSLRGAVVVHDELARQLRVEFVPLRGNQRMVLDAVQVKAYGYVHKQDTLRYVAVAINSGTAGKATSHVFLRQLAAGPVELYEYRYATNQPYATPQPSAWNVTARTTAVTAAHPLLYPGSAAASQAAYAQSLPALTARSARSGSGITLLLRNRIQNAITEAVWQNFSAEAANYFASCPGLAADLQANRYKPRDITKIVRRYSAWQATARPASR